MQRVVWLAVAMTIPLLSGCLDFFDGGNDGTPTPPDVGYDASAIEVVDVTQHSLNITSFDGTDLATLIYEPLPRGSLPDGTEPRFPVVVFMHGWGFAKEQFQNVPFNVEGMEQPTDVLDEFARAGFLVVAYDSRGFGQSGGEVSAAGPKEQADLDAVLDYAESRFSTNGRNGITGHSYGGGQAMLAWALNDRFVTAVPMTAWTDLYESIAPGNVPKMQWAQTLYAEGTATSGGSLSPEVSEWYVQAYSRDDPDTVESQMDLRSILGKAPMVDKPLMTCQGMQETLFHQAHLAWMTAPAQTHAHYHDGGHVDSDRDCYTKAREWFGFHLAGIDNGVGGWPLLDTVSTAGDDAHTYRGVPSTETATYYLREPQLVDFASPSSEVTISQSLLANPFSEPSVVWDATGGPNEALPEQFRQDPTGVFFSTEPLDGSDVLIGAPRLTLHATDATMDGPYQVAATLYHDSDGSSRIIGRTAYSVLDEGDHVNGTVVLEFPWIRTDLKAGDQLTLKLASNDPNMFMPLFADYDVTFTGDSSLDLPFFSA